MVLACMACVGRWVRSRSSPPFAGWRWVRSREFRALVGSFVPTRGRRHRLGSFARVEAAGFVRAISRSQGEGRWVRSLAFSNRSRLVICRSGRVGFVRAISQPDFTRSSAILAGLGSFARFSVQRSACSMGDRADPIVDIMRDFLDAWFRSSAHARSRVPERPTLRRDTIALTDPTSRFPKTRVKENRPS